MKADKKEDAAAERTIKLQEKAIQILGAAKKIEELGARARSRSRSTPKARAKAEAKARARSAGADDDAVISQINVNKSEDMDFWKQASANELRTQLKLRDRDRYLKEWAFKKKPELFKIIEELIKNKQW